MGIDLLCALGCGVVAALAGWPITRWVLRGAARERSRRVSGKGPAADPQDGVDAAEHDGAELDAAAGNRPAAGDTASPATSGASARGGEAAASVPGGSDEAPVDAPGLLRGGLAIGLLERFLVAGGIALGQPAVLAVVVAVKGLGRIPELRVSRAAGERFIIGFASLAVAGILGYAGRYLAGLV